MQMTSKWKALADLGQSVWYDNVARPALESGLLAKLMAEDNVTGGTSNPSIFANAVQKSDMYDADIAAAPADATPVQVFERMASADITNACDLMRPAWERAGGHDGFISLEVEADLAFEEDQTVARARSLWSIIDRPNLMVKVPGTAEGVKAFRRLTADGININVTLLFGVERYREIADAYIDALEQRLEAGGDLSHVDSVASFFVSRIDNKVDERLPEDSPLRGRIAIANAKIAYEDVYKVVHSGPRWERLKAAGANPQRALWASTSTKNPAYPPTLYVDELIGPDTVNTVPDVTLDAFREGGHAARTLDRDVDGARAELQALADAGISLKEITDELEREGVDAFQQAYNGMIEAIADKRGRVAAD
jgi:transaldolase